MKQRCHTFIGKEGIKLIHENGFNILSSIFQGLTVIFALTIVTTQTLSKHAIRGPHRGGAHVSPQKILRI